MRRLLVTLALIGLMLSPAAASAAAMRCVHEHGDMAMVMDAGAAVAEVADAAHACCDENLQSSEHDRGACAQDCIAMGGISVALSSAPGLAILRLDRATLVPRAEDSIRPFAPPGLKRPPKAIA